MKRLVNSVFRRYARKFSPGLRRESHPWAHLREKTNIESLIHNAEIATNTPASHKRRDSLINLHGVLRACPVGPTAECGVFQGLTSYFIKSITNQEHYMIDSYEGLSDVNLQENSPFKKGNLSCSLNNVKKNMEQFLDIQYIKGWVPDILTKLKEQKYAFVHLDMDISLPMSKALRYFYPRMMEGGMIVCDDYGEKAWPKLRPTIDQTAQNLGARVIGLSTLQAVIL